MVSSNPDELEAELEAIEFQGDVETLRTLRSEADLTVGRQLATLTDIDDKASRMLRLNVLLVGVVVSGLSIASQLGVDSGHGVPIVDQFQNAYVEIGVASLVVSTALAAVTYSATEYDVGISAENAMKLLVADLPDREVEAMLVKNYVARVNFNRSPNVRNLPLVTATIVFAVGGIVLLSLGTYQATVRPVTWWLSLGGILVVGAVVLASGFVTQADRAIEDVRAWRR